MDDPNLEGLRTVYDALSSGDVVSLMGTLSDDIVAHVPGRSPVAGDYVGKNAVGEYIGKLGELSGGLCASNPMRFSAQASTAPAWSRTWLERGDKVLTMNNVHIWHMADGTQKKIWIYPGDLYACDNSTVLSQPVGLHGGAPLWPAVSTTPVPRRGEHSTSLHVSRRANRPPGQPPRSLMVSGHRQMLGGILDSFLAFTAALALALA